MKIAVLGAGAAGTAITSLLIKEPGVKAVTVMDRNGNALDQLEEQTRNPKVRVHRLGVEKETAIAGLIRGYNCLISALPYSQNYKVAKLALKAGVNYVDLGGDDETLVRQFKLNNDAKDRNIYLVPGSGFAPGLVNVLAMHGYESFDSVDDILIRASALPLEPIEPLNYHLGFSPIGLVNEYTSKVWVIEEGTLQQKDALEGYETMTFNSNTNLGNLEAFYTSGSSTMLVRELEGKVRNFNFKSLRYPGHRNIIKAFISLGFNSEQIIDIQTQLTYKELFIRQLKKFLPQSKNDIALARVTVAGIRNGRPAQRTYELKMLADEQSGISAMMTCTAWSAIQTALLISSGKTKAVGGVYVPETLVPKDDYIEFIRQHGIELFISDEDL